MSALPLFWGERGAHAVLHGEDQRAPFVRRLSELRTLVPVDRIDRNSLASIGTLLLAQPRGLTPEELVALDGWVREGGRILIFADPLLAWPSVFGWGDRRRAPPITLLDPLIAHWGLELESPEVGAASSATLSINGLSAAGAGMGQWQSATSDCRVSGDRTWVECRIGKGRALLVGDADLLNLEDVPDNLPALLALLARLETVQP